jgi:hypothetical protein
MESVREKTSVSNEPIFKEEKTEFLIALIAISCFPLLHRYYYSPLLMNP